MKRSPYNLQFLLAQLKVQGCPGDKVCLESSQSRVSPSAAPCLMKRSAVFAFREPRLQRLDSGPIAEGHVPLGGLSALSSRDSSQNGALLSF